MSKTGLRTTIIVVLLAAIAIAIGAVMLKPAAPLPPQKTINTANQPTLGNANAKVHIVAFEDLKCANCKLFNNNLLPKIKKKYVKTGVASYTMINLAFIDSSITAANAARCVYAQNKALFFPYVEYIYHHQPAEDTNWTTIPKLMEFASNIPGINNKKLSRCLVKGTYYGFINNNLKIARKIMGETISTPTIYIDGRKLSPMTMKQVDRLVKAAQ